jgi:hypothetical protein
VEFAINAALGYASPITFSTHASLLSARLVESTLKRYAKKKRKKERKKRKKNQRRLLSSSPHRFHTAREYPPLEPIETHSVHRSASAYCAEGMSVRDVISHLRASET